MMSKSFLVRLLVVALLVATGFIAFLSANHSWRKYHWARTSNPFTLKLGDNVSPTWDSYLATTSYDWSLSTVLDTTIVAGGTNSTNCQPTAGRIEVCNASYGNTGWLGLAQIWVSPPVHITQAITKMNDTYFNTTTYNTPGWRNLVMCQEVGHTFGLDHQDTKFTNINLGTCMDYTNNPYGPPDNEHPNQHDYDQLETIYGHFDSTTTVSSSTLPSKMPPAMGQIAFDTPAQWGQLVATTHNGRTAIYELDFGGGHKVFTFVIWA